MPIVIKDIIWLETIVEKLAWKHRVIPHEVEEMLSGNAGYSSERAAMSKEKIFTTPSGKQMLDGIYRSFLLRS